MVHPMQQVLEPPLVVCWDLKTAATTEKMMVRQRAEMKVLLMVRRLALQME